MGDKITELSFAGKPKAPNVAERFSVHEWYDNWLILDRQNGQAIKVLTKGLALVYCRILNEGHRKLRGN